MAIVAWGLLGMLLGAAGVGYLRATRPELVGKVEDAAKRLVDHLCPPKPSNQEKTEEE